VEKIAWELTEAEEAGMMVGTLNRRRGCLLPGHASDASKEFMKPENNSGTLQGLAVLTAPYQDEKHTGGCKGGLNTECDHSILYVHPSHLGTVSSSGLP